MADELKSIQEDLLWTEKAHFATAASYARLHLTLGILATVAASVAAATVISENSPAVAVSAAVISAIASAVVTFLKPQEAEQRYLSAGRQLGALRVRVRHVIHLDLHSDQSEEPEVWRAKVKELAEDKAKIDAESPGTSNRAFRTARKKIQAGHFDHD